MMDLASKRRRSSANEIWYDARRWSLHESLPSNHNGTDVASPVSIIRRSSSIVWEETRPQTPKEWTVVLAALASLVFGYELQLQQQLTCPPFVFCQDTQDNQVMQAIYQQLTTQKKNAILSQPIQPSLWVGTRSALSTGLAVIAGHPHTSHQHLQFRELVRMPADGATLALDWEAPGHLSKPQLLSGPIEKPVVLILHGLNNDASASYIQALQRALTNRGHIAVGMNFRGCGGVPLTNPRPYTGAYTGDLRSVVHMLEGRLASPDVPLFLVGNSLGANLITKYLGEEGLSGTLPSCVQGGVSLANPLHIHSKNNVHFPMSQLMAGGVKLAMATQLSSWVKTLQYPEFRQAMMGVLKASTIDQVDAAMCPIILRNEPHYPYTVRIGYESVEDYWRDCSSYRLIQHVSVPLLQIIAGDDPVVYKAFQRKLAHCSLNPNVMSVETKCGGHLGWQESPPANSPADDSGFQPTWAGRATADFIDAILKVGPIQPHKQPTPSCAPPFAMASWESPPEPKTAAKEPPQVPVLQSRL